MGEKNTNEFTIFPKQREFINSIEPEVLSVGGSGSGKSLALCLKIAKEVISKPNNVVLLCRRYGNTIRKTTLVNFLDGIAPLPAVLGYGSYDFNNTTNTIKLKNGSIIYCCGLDDVQKIRSMTVGMVAVDELSEVEDFGIWQELKLRIRLPIGSGQIIAAQNPGSTSSWQYEYFVENKDPITKKSLDNNNRKCIFSSSFDNKALPKAYVDILNSMDGSIKERMVEGKFVDSEKMVYGDVLVRKCMVKDLPNREKIKKWYVSMDYGFTNPCSLILSGLDSDNNLWIYECEEKAQLIQSKILDWIKKYKEYEPTVLVDPSAAQLIADFQGIGFTAIKAENDILIGIDRARSLMDKGQIKINENCSSLLNSLRGYMYGIDGKPIKKNEHSADSLRYVISTCWNELNTQSPLSNFIFG